MSQEQVSWYQFSLRQCVQCGIACTRFSNLLHSFFFFKPQLLQNSSFTSMCWQIWEQPTSCYFTQLWVFWANWEMRSNHSPEQVPKGNICLVYPRGGETQLLGAYLHLHLPTADKEQLGIHLKPISKDKQLVQWFRLGHLETLVLPPMDFIAWPVTLPTKASVALMIFIQISGFQYSAFSYWTLCTK